MKLDCRQTDCQDLGETCYAVRATFSQAPRGLSYKVSGKDRGESKVILSSYRRYKTNLARTEGNPKITSLKKPQRPASTQVRLMAYIIFPQSAHDPVERLP